MKKIKRGLDKFTKAIESVHPLVYAAIGLVFHSMVFLMLAVIVAIERTNKK